MNDWRGPVLIAMWSCFPLAAACSPHSQAANGSNTQTSEPATCMGACVYQSNVDNTCGTGPQPPPNEWWTICTDRLCGEVSRDPMASLDPISGCVTNLVYRNWSGFGGTCDDWTQANLQLPEAGPRPEGLDCNSNADCASNNCVGNDSAGYFCMNDCEDGGTCSAGFACSSGYCVPPCLQ
jgi:hypothetical protein